ncbi:MAG: hypothetical protein NTW14_00330 [bacterium]|nr:hypothetical protein [bacterium]
MSILCAVKFSSGQSTAGDQYANRIILLPFQNLSGVSDAKLVIMSAIREKLRKAGFNPVSDSLLSPALRKYRLRDTSQLSAAESDSLSKNLDTPWIVLGSIDYYSDQENFEVGLSFRLFDSRTHRIVWADSRCSSRDDHIKILGIRAVESLTQLIDLEIESAITSLVQRRQAMGGFTDYQNTQNSNQPVVFLIPFGNVTESAVTSKIFDHYLLSALVRHGYNVIEPGIVNHELYLKQLLLKGEIDQQTLIELGQKFSAGYCMTGLLSRYGSVYNPDMGNIPDLEVETRMLVAVSARICWAQKIERSGSDGRKIFQIGQIHTYGALFNATLDEMLDSLPTKTIAEKSETTGN